MKVIRWKHIACALGIAAHTAHLKSEIWYKTVWIHEKAPSTEVRNWLWVIMHKHQMPWHFLSLPNNHLPLLCLFAINDWILYPFLPHPSPEKKIPFLLCVYIPNTHSCYQYTWQHAQQSLSSAFRWWPMETVLISSLLPQSTAVCFGIRGFLWRLHMHTHWLEAREGERQRWGWEGRRERARERERVLLLNITLSPPSFLARHTSQS